MEAPAVLDVAAHLVRRVEVEPPLPLDEVLRRTRPVAGGFPVLQLQDHGRGPFVALPEEDDVAPRRRGRQPVLHRDGPALPHVEVVAAERPRAGASREAPRRASARPSTPPSPPRRTAPSPSAARGREHRDPDSTFSQNCPTSRSTLSPVSPRRPGRAFSQRRPEREIPRVPAAGHVRPPHRLLGARQELLERLRQVVPRQDDQARLVARGHHAEPPVSRSKSLGVTTPESGWTMIRTFRSSPCHRSGVSTATRSLRSGREPHLHRPVHDPVRRAEADVLGLQGLALPVDHAQSTSDPGVASRVRRPPPRSPRRSRAAARRPAWVACSRRPNRRAGGPAPCRPRPLERPPASTTRSPGCARASNSKDRRTIG